MGDNMDAFAEWWARKFPLLTRSYLRSAYDDGVRRGAAARKRAEHRRRARDEARRGVR